MRMCSRFTYWNILSGKTRKSPFLVFWKEKMKQMTKTYLTEDQQISQRGQNYFPMTPLKRCVKNNPYWVASIFKSVGNKVKGTQLAGMFSKGRLFVTFCLLPPWYLVVFALHFGASVHVELSAVRHVPQQVLTQDQMVATHLLLVHRL